MVLSKSQQPRFDAAMFRAALDYYGLPGDYNRFFTRGDSLRRRQVRRGMISFWAWWSYNAVPGYPERDSEDGRVVWTQVNLPAASHPFKKAEVPDIELYQNLTLDFEYPPDPSIAVAIGIKLAKHLLELGLAEAHHDWLLQGEPGLPIEYSGAGVHICLPLTPLRTATLGGPETLNDAVYNLVLRYIQPPFDRLAANAGLDGKMRLDGYDISQVLSLPGTWRPSDWKPDDCERLRSGVLREWIKEDSQSNILLYPHRRESAVLAHLIIEECELLSESNASIRYEPDPPDSITYLTQPVQ